MQDYDNRVYDGECACLPDIAWLLVIVALVPHLLGLVGTAATAAIASCACFPASMGPFAVVHTYLLIGRLGYTSHMSWISAISFSLLWSAFLVLFMAEKQNCHRGDWHLLLHRLCSLDLADIRAIVIK